MHNDANYWDSLAGHSLDGSVIDPNDTLGYKNTYIAQVRNAALIEVLENNDAIRPILDFGCGTGGLSVALSRAGFKTIGIDISLGLLKRCKDRETSTQIPILQFDGKNVPLADQSISAAATYGVLMYIPDELLAPLLCEISRTLKPGGELVVMEQLRLHEKMIKKHGKLHRSVDGFRHLVESAGFVAMSSTVCRYGHFPFLYAVRYGLVPRGLFGALRAMERAFGRLFGVFPGDYADVRIVFRKRSTAAIGAPGMK